MLQEGWQTFWGSPRQCGYGEAILVHRDLSVGVLPDCDPILSIAVKTSGGNLIRIGNIYSPTSNHAVDDQSAFFHHLQKWCHLPHSLPGFLGPLSPL